MFDKEDNKYLQAMQGVIIHLSVLGPNRAHSATDSLVAKSVAEHLVNYHSIGNRIA